MNIDYAANEPKGREFKGEGFIWILIFDGMKSLYGKVDKASLEAALNRQPFELWHPMMLTPQGMVYMSSATKTIEPWIMVNASTICNIHPSEAENFDKMTRQLLSGILTATPADVPKKSFKLTE